MKSIPILMAGIVVLVATTVPAGAQRVTAGAAPSAALPDAQKRYETAQTEYRTAQAEAELAQTARSNARSAAGAAAGAIDSFGGSAGFGAVAGPATIFSGSSRESVAPVVIQFSESDPTNTAMIEEDLTVMTRLIDHAIERAVGEESPLYKSGIPMVVTSSGRSVRAMYVEDFGALFMVKVNLPLLGTAKRDEPGEPEPEPAKTEWNRAREELFPSRQPRRSRAEEDPFNPAQVEALKKELLAVLKQAMNVRHLKPDDFVSINVFGQPDSGAVRVAGAILSRDAKSSATSPQQANQPGYAGYEYRKYEFQPYEFPFAGHSVGSRGTVMTLRAKRSDIDAFAKGESDFEAFQEKAAVTIYSGSGYDMKSVNSWVKGQGATFLRR